MKYVIFKLPYIGGFELNPIVAGCKLSPEMNIYGMDRCLSLAKIAVYLQQLVALQLNCAHTHKRTRKRCYRKENRAMRHVYGCPEKFRESLAMPTAAFPEIVNWLLL